jgi:glycine cleavage system H protein
MSQLPAELKYVRSHEWVRIEGDIATVGITDHAQNALGDVVYVELPDVGSQLHAMDEAGVVESVKAASDVYAPISGEVIAINEDLEDSPETINRDPYHDGWFYQLRISDTDELEDLLDAEGYQQSLEEDADE